MLLATIERFPFLFELQQAAHKIRINILPQRLLRKDVTGFTTMRMWVQSTAKRANIVDTGMEKGESLNMIPLAYDVRIIRGYCSQMKARDADRKPLHTRQLEGLFRYLRMISVATEPLVSFLHG